MTGQSHQLLSGVTFGIKRYNLEQISQYWKHLLSLSRSLAATGQPSNDLYSPTAQAHIYTSPTLLPLTKKQRRLVTNNPGTIVAIAKGARMAVDECQYQFKDRRWNCSAQVNGHGGSIFGKIIEKGKLTKLEKNIRLILFLFSLRLWHSLSFALYKVKVEDPLKVSFASQFDKWLKVRGFCKQSSAICL